MMPAPGIRSPEGVGVDVSGARPRTENTGDREVAVMPGIGKRTGLGRGLGLRLLGYGLLVPLLAGCAAVSQDVDAYYRQMATNYQEAREKARMDAASIKKASGMLLAAGDTAGYQKNQRRLERIEAWELRCARQEERFQKAAAWMETHFDLKESRPGGPSSPVRGKAAGTQPHEADSRDPSVGR
jgi:hypothetical protein